MESMIHPRSSISKRLRRFGIATGILAILLVSLLISDPGRYLAWIGRALVVSDILQKADAIVVLGGSLPFRSAEAARLCREGWAPQVWITAPEGPSEVEAIKVLGLAPDPFEPLSVRVLEKFGVPASAIRVLSPEAQDTVDEIRLITAELTETGLRRAIIVTSPSHTRRVRALWRIFARPGQQGFVHHIDRENFDPDRWWATERDRSRVAHEMAGLVYARFGLPLGKLIRRVFSPT
jgi:uncharacterized SAM-binding protein YcdF (DUF218 family)